MELNYLTSSLIHLINPLCLVFLLQLAASWLLYLLHTASVFTASGAMIFPTQCQPPALQSSCRVSSPSLIQRAARLWTGTSGGLLLSFWMQPRGSGWWEGRTVCMDAVMSVQLTKQDLTCFSDFTDVACGSQCTAALPPFTSPRLSTQTLTGALSFPDVQIWDNFLNILTKRFMFRQAF